MTGDSLVAASSKTMAMLSQVIFQHTLHRHKSFYFSFVYGDQVTFLKNHIIHGYFSDRKIRFFFHLWFHRGDEDPLIEAMNIKHQIRQSGFEGRAAMRPMAAVSVSALAD